VTTVPEDTDVAALASAVIVKDVEVVAIDA